MSKVTKLESLLEAVPEALVGIDPSGDIWFVNHRTELLFGYKRDDLVGRRIETLVPKAPHHVRSTPTEDSFTNPESRSMGLDLEMTARNHDGSAFQVNVSVSKVGTEDVLLEIEAVRDSPTVEKAFETAQRMTAIVKNCDDAIIGKTLDGTITSWNPAAERMYGYSGEEAIGRSIHVLAPDDRDHEIDAILDRIASRESVEHFETIRVRKDGTEFWVSLSVSPICSEGGTVVGAATIARDMTGARAASELARAMLESSHDSLVSISEEGRIIDANEATVKATGVSRDELIGTTFSDYFTEPDKACQAYGQVFAEGAEAGAEDHVLCIRHRDGKLTDVVYNANVYRGSCGEVLAVFAAARDVTKLAQAAKAARTMMESSLDSLVSISPDGKLTDVNKATVKVTGIPRDQLIGTAFSDYFTNRASATRIYKLVFEEGTVVDYPLSICHRDGTLTDVLYNASLHRDAEGSVLGVFAAARDVTKQVDAQKAYECQQAKEREKMVELEGFQRLMVGRELKMAQLKREVTVLQEENDRLRGTTSQAAPH